MRVRYVAAAMGMAIAIPFMAPVPAYADEPGTTVFSDNFATQNTTLWSWSPNASVSNGQLNLPVLSNNYEWIASTSGYDFTDLTYTARYVTPPAVSNGTTESEIIIQRLQSDNTIDSYMWGTTGGNLAVIIFTPAAPNQGIIPWHSSPPAFPVWLRIRHSSATGLLYFETSPDSITWTTRYSEAPRYATTTNYMTVAAGAWDVDTSGPAIWDNFSLVHNAPVSPPPP